MTVCKHCGTEIEDGLEYCPNCGQSVDDILGDFFSPVEELEEEAYNIFDAPEEFDMDSLLSREFEQSIEVSKSEFSDFPGFEEEPDDFPVSEEFASAEYSSEPEQPDILDFFAEAESAMPEETIQNTNDTPDDLAELLGLFGEDPAEVEEISAEEIIGEDVGEMDLPVAEEADFFALDDLFQDLDGEAEELVPDAEPADPGLEALLASTAVEEKPSEKQKKDKKKKQKKEKKSFFQTVFGNVPVDPSKIKPEPTPEQIAAKKQKEAEEKKAKEEEKKLAAEEKKQLAQREKDEKARQKALAKEEKKAKKLEEAKQILEEMKETRINRLGATIVFVFFAVCAIVLLSGSEIFGYAISIQSAEKNFNKALNNNVKYYTDAYNDIYGLDIKEEDQQLNDKIMTVMFVNKELNSYNSYMRLGDFEAALHSLLLGLYRYGTYYGTTEVIALGIDKDLDFVRTQILKALKAEFDVSEDEAEVLRSMLAKAGAGGMHSDIDEDAAREYNLELYKIVLESGLNDDSNN